MLNATYPTPKIGVEIKGADLAGALDDATMNEILTLPNHNGVAVIRTHPFTGRKSQHCAVGDYQLPLRRLLYRAIVQGDKPF